MASWNKVADTCAPLLPLLREALFSGPLVNGDETTVHVLNEPGRSPATKSFMWVFRGGPPGMTVCLYHYDPGRSGNVAATFLKGYQGVVQTDGYAGYDFLANWPEVEHAGCWAHARRKFMEAQKGLGKTGKACSSIDIALSYIQKIYAVEHEGHLNNYSPEQMKALRQEKAKPRLEDFHQWLNKKSSQVVPKNLMGKAVSYTLKQWDRLLVYLDHGEVTADNNTAENAIRPFMIGRKNWLFAGTPEGAKASALLYSLIETAKTNKLEPYKYLRYLFEKLPFATTDDEYRKLLPCNLTMANLTFLPVVTGV
jgi:transposase